jgi:type II secretory pathway component PulK
MFAVSIGMSIRQRASLLSRLEVRSQLRWIAEAGAKKAFAAIKENDKRQEGLFNAQTKSYLLRNDNLFKNIALGKGSYAVSDFSKIKDLLDPVIFGIVDEDRKINLNTASLDELIRLVQAVTASDSNEAQAVVESVLDWRETGEGQLTSFYSDDYYYNLEYPFEPKDAQFELLDELLLIRGVTPAVFKQLRPFVTIYGDGQVNINTADREVLAALGLSEGVIDKILTVRVGVDGEESTTDDYVFTKTYDIASDMLKFLKMELDEIREVDRLNSLAKLKTASSIYSVQSRAILQGKSQSLMVNAVFDARENRVLYWSEKF